ncbi:MAG: hypothetical protein MJE77_27485 [Proteobacteria bacterium]|nr:hypothetical protein [Pseudomonadota bacterium]
MLSAALAKLTLPWARDLRMMESCRPRHFALSDFSYWPSDAAILKWHALRRARARRLLSNSD